MAIQAIIGFEHLEGVATPYNYFDHNLTFSPATGGSTAIIQNGWLTSANNTAVYEWLKFQLGQYCTGSLNEITMGFRVNLVGYASGTYMVDALGARVFLQSDIPNAATGVSAFLEISINLTTGVMRRWVDGVQLSNGATLSAAQLTAAKAGTLEIQFYTKGNVAAAISKFRDFYVTDDLGSNVPVGRLGSMVVVPVTLDSANASNWTTTTGTVLQALATAGEVPTANVATSSTTNDILTASLKATIPTGSTCKGIELTTGGKSISSGPTTSSAKLKNGSNELAAKNIVYPTTQANSNSLGIFYTAPDGTAWTNSSIDATDLIITPDTGA